MNAQTMLLWMIFQEQYLRTQAYCNMFWAKDDDTEREA